MIEPITELALVEEHLWVVSRRTGLAVYDFDFASSFALSHPALLPPNVVAVARLGALENYREQFEKWRERGVRFVNSPADANRADDLSEWYPLISDLTPRSAVFDSLPPASEIAELFGWPVFLKGVRQTSRHDASLAIARSSDEYLRVFARWKDNPILSSQRVAAREYVPLRQVAPAPHAGELPRSFEFRTFWWHGRLVGEGPYWNDAGKYEWSSRERSDGLAVAGEAARRIAVGFLCVDVAQTAEGRWIVIEVNDGQRSGYAGVPRVALWRAVIHLLKGAS